MEYTWKEEGGAEGAIRPGSVVISAFPSAGLATTVAAHYMIRVLKIPRVGRFESPDIAPVAVIQGGEVHPTVRVYGRQDLALVLSEFPPTPPQANALARTILAGAESRRARLIICLEGVVPHPGDSDEEEAPAGEAPDEQIWAAYSQPDPALRKTFEATKARSLEDGVIGGVSGALLVQGIGRSIPVATILVSARVAEGLPDHRAGAALIEALDRLLPELKIDTKPLREQAEQIERALRSVMKSHPADATSESRETPPGPPEMYG
ncbi:MAG: proteasome assembly chaperone family protein [Thermoplasmata archaeon]